MSTKIITPETKVFPANYVLLFWHFLQSYQKEHPSKLKLDLASIKIPKSIINNPEQYVSYQFLVDFFGQILEHIDIPEIGLSFGKYLNFTAHGEMGNAIITSQNLGEAFDVLIKFYKTRSLIADADYEIYDDRSLINISFNFTNKKLEYFLIDALFANIITVRKFILSNTDYDISIHLARPKPENPKPYYEIFGDNVFFEAAKNEYYFPSKSLQLAFPLSNPIAREVAERKCQQKLEELEKYEDIISKIKSIMLATPSFFPSLEEVSQKLFMSTRTLRRKLKELNTSYQEILDQVRKELAISYLQNSQLSIIEIAHLLQFSDSSNFSNAFRKWTDKSPTEFRK